MRSSVRRSMIYVPGDSEAMLQKSVRLSADMLLLNLEDGVAASRKEVARENVVHALKSLNFESREAVVRINPMDTKWGFLDLAAIIPARPNGICLPKIEKASEIAMVESAIADLEGKASIPVGSIQIHAMIESAAGVLRASEIAAASPRMASLVFGSADYIADVRCQPGEDRIELLLVLQMLVVSARAAGIDAIDAPCFDLRNSDALFREASQARRLGFDGKSVLHPSQLDIINEVFDVTAAEIAWAEKTIAELDEAENRGKALTTVDGQLIDNPHRITAEKILRRKSLR
jgi:citrate lyase subunit beta / citryl-CoA lyase